MRFMQLIYWAFFDIAGFFHGLYLETKDLVWLPSFISTLFNWLDRSFLQLCVQTIDFETWLIGVRDKINQFFTWLDLEAWFKDWKAKILDAWIWVIDWWNNTLSAVSSWWDSTKSTVLGWIEVAKQWAGELISQVSNWLSWLQVSWDNFTKSILPTLATLTQVDSLVDSTLKRWFPFYDTLSQLWDSIAEFFTDPLQWVYNKLDDFFERFW